MSVSPARAAEVHALRESITAWAKGDSAIEAVLLAGSWARDEARMDSDVDVVVITTDTERYVTTEDWIATASAAPSAELIRTADWGALTERRVRLPLGLEVEFGFVEETWADTAPIDPGTHRVVTDGCEPWHDPTGLLARLLSQAAEHE